MKKIIAWITVIIFILLTGITGSACSQVQQAPITISTAVESSTAETTLIEISTEETAAEEKIAENFEILYVPKLTPPEGLGTVPWFDTVEAGLIQCASDYGFKSTAIGPPKADPAIQAQIVLDNIGKNFDAIIVCPIEDKIIDSAFERANKAGVLTFSNEGYTLKNVTFDIAAMSNQAFGQAIMEAGAKYTNGTGKYLVSVGFLNSIVHNEWADAEIEYQKNNITGLSNILGYSKGTDRFEDNEDPKIANEKLTQYISNNKDLNLIIGNSASTGMAAGEVISKKRLKGKLFYVGMGLPVSIGRYISEGVLQEGFFWDPYKLGYAMGYIAYKTWLATEISEGHSVIKPDGSKIEGYEEMMLATNSQGGNIIAGNAIESINIDNIEEWYTKFESYGWPQR
ncbi:MAG: substrate-binding domain-containing protein [Actinobacteria bacterium]|nr:substrate-binding domain-containing protein [Actinomycetota bacterium]